MRDQFREKMEALISKRDLVSIVPKRKSILGRKKHVNPHVTTRQDQFFFLG